AASSSLPTARCASISRARSGASFAVPISRLARLRSARIVSTSPSSARYALSCVRISSIGTSISRSAHALRTAAVCSRIVWIESTLGRADFERAHGGDRVQAQAAYVLRNRRVTNAVGTTQGLAPAQRCLLYPRPSLAAAPRQLERLAAERPG